MSKIRKFPSYDGGTAWALTHIDAVMGDDGQTLRQILTSITALDPTQIAQVMQELSEKYVKPLGGIPSADMTSEVQVSLGKADNSVQIGGSTSQDFAANNLRVSNNATVGGTVSAYGSITAEGDITSSANVLGQNVHATDSVKVGNIELEQDNNSLSIADQGSNKTVVLPTDKDGTVALIGDVIAASVYDVTAQNGGAAFASLSALLSDANLSTLIPTAVRKGGMSIRFVQSSDNSYVQYRLMVDEFSTTESDWQGVDAEPTAGSKNMVESGGVFDVAYKDDIALSASFKNNLIRKDYSQIILVGNLYNGYFDAGDKTCLTIDEYFEVFDGQTKLLMGLAYDLAIRVTFYDSLKVYISNTGAYSALDLVEIPLNAKFYKLSANYTSRGYSTSENPIKQNDYVVGDFYPKVLSAIVDDVPTEMSNNPVSSDGVKTSIGGDVDLSKLPITGYDDNSNWIYTNSYKGVCLKCKSGDTFVITANGSHNSFYSFLTTLPAPGTSPVPRVTGTTRQTINTGETVNVTAPEGAEYIHFSKLWSNADALPSKVVRIPHYVGVVDNLTSDDINLPLSARQGKVLKGFTDRQDFNLIPVKSFVVGRYDGDNYIDTSKKFAISTKNDFFFIHHLQKLFVNAVLNDYTYSIRVLWYDVDKTYIRYNNYSDWQSIVIPATAFYCKFCFIFSTETDIVLSDLVEGNFITNAITVDSQAGYNNDVSITVPISKGYLNFDNVNKKLAIKGGNIAFPYNGNFIYKNVGYEIEYPSNLKIASGNYFYILFNGTDLSIIVANAPVYWNTIKDRTIIATIGLTVDNYIGRNNISFSTVPFKIDDDLMVDLTKVAEFSSHLVSDNLIETFLFFTDPHLENNAFVNFDQSEVMQNIVNYYKMAALEKCVCGGDWINQFNNTEGQTDGDNLAAACLGNAYGYCKSVFHDFLPVIGNHEYNTYTAKPAMPNETVVNIFTQKYGKGYYYEDNHNSRYYIFDTGYVVTSAPSAYDYEQIDWFANNLLNSNIENVVIFLHIAVINTNNDYSGLATKLAELSDAYNTRSTVTINEQTYDFTGVTSGKVRCIIGGHSHRDFSGTCNNIPVVLSTHAQAGFDLCAVDYEEGKLYMTRIGSGESREINLA